MLHVLRPQLRTSLKLALPSLLSLLLFLAAVLWLILPGYEANLMEQKRQSLRTLTKTAIGILQASYDQELAGTLSRDESQVQAAKLVASLRFGPENKDYFWINDADYVLIMHPYRTDLVDKHLENFEDVQGKKLFREFVDATKETGEAFVDYQWQYQDSPGTSDHKLSHVQRFQPWGWIVGTGVYLGDIETEITTRTNQVIGIAAAIFCLLTILAAFALWHGRSVARDISENEQRYQDIINNAPIGMFQSTPEGRFLTVNPSMARTYGYDSPEDMIRSITDIASQLNVTPQHRQTMLDLLARDGEVRNYISPRRTKNGAIIWTSLNLRSVLDKKGHISHFEGFSTEVTTRIQAEEALQATLTELEAIFENSQVGIMLIRDYHILSRGNQRLAEIFEYDNPAEMEGISMRSLHISEDNFNAFGEKYYEGLRHGEQIHVEYQLRRKDGSPVWCLLSGKAMDTQSPPDLSKGVLWIIDDISRRKRAEDMLIETYESFLTVLGSMDTGIYVSDIETYEILFMNKTLSDSFGGDASGKLCHKVFRNKDEPCEDCSNSRLLDEHGNPTGVYVWEDSNPLTGRYLLNQDRAIRWVDGSMVRLQVAMDITERKRQEEAILRAKEAAEESSRAKSEFLANMSHEIRTPLNGVLGMLQLIRGLEDIDLRDEYIDIALSSARALLTILEDVLSLSSIEAGAVTLRGEPFSPKDIIASTVRAFELETMERNLTLTHTLDPALPEILWGDESRLRQILFNLVGNALKFTFKGSIHLSFQALPIQPDPEMLQVLFVVSDTGIGIPDDRQTDIFELFTQVDGSFTRRFQGSGLGLGIVRRLVTLMGGSLCLDSSLGQGSTFYFTLRLKTTDTVMEKPAKACARPQSALRVLVAEDDRVNRITAERFLERLGHTPTSVENGEQAVQAVATGDFDVVLMDMQMPVMDGPDATRLIRALPGKASQIPIVALTAFGQTGDRERFLNMGLDGYLKKPMDMGELSDILAQMTLQS